MRAEMGACSPGVVITRAGLALAADALLTAAQTAVPTMAMACFTNVPGSTTRLVRAYQYTGEVAGGNGAVAIE